MSEIAIPDRSLAGARLVLGAHIPDAKIEAAIRAALTAWPGMAIWPKYDIAIEDLLILPLPEDAEKDEPAEVTIRKLRDEW